VAVRPLDGLAVRLTVPLKPFWAVTVIAEVAVAPALIVRLVGLAAIVKSCTVKVTVVDADCEPLVPDTVTV